MIWLGLYCQDPDTKKLYPVNATWPSQSFCGNYTCKLRKKNHTQTEYMPIKKINITDNFISKLNDMSTSPSQQNFVKTNLQEEKRPIFEPDSFKNINDINKETYRADDKDDRYLTEAEIKTITDILHTVKKSDLEAIVEIYNLAQDIYKESDGGIFENKQKSTEPSKEIIHMEQNSTDITKDDTRSLSTRNYRQPLTYFTAPFTDKDFGKLPYYYPMSHFHRTASNAYSRPYTTPVVPTTRPCTKKPPAKLLQLPWYDRTIIRPYIKQQRLPSARPMLLPYPFSYVHNYNYNAYPPSFYYNNYPWAQLNSYNKKGYYPYFGYVAQTPIVDIDPENIKDKEIVEDMKDDIKPEEVLPEWQTEQLSANVLEEVKANVLHKSKLLKPSGKTVKLERVGKVIKIDELTREKRHVITDRTDVEEYETYLASTICQPSTEPGFFRVGNLSAPFPACCPQKIRQ
ncbi:uncharacterized protein LOC119836573 [Zerene cesonia]|uniref:uncharacterized protein LOC119836573 n=1 Tax=Zerene cesonia TaxID=33412 RepID=UPI0018E4EF40|nr:uncharacterized protein LOC119836573 [Zerene cesonia]